MKKQEIESVLKLKSKNRSVKLPRDIKFKIEGNFLIIELLGEKIIKNMQTDESAFEGWAVVIKSWIKEVDNVVLKWEKPIWSKLPEEKKKEELHYERLLYRARRFQQSYKWFHIDSENQEDIDNLKLDKKEGKEFKLNAPSKKRTRNTIKLKELSEYRESELEEFIVSQKEKELMEVANLNYLDNQFPVGCFHTKVNNDNRVFTGGKSAIDIWGINNKNEFCLFELKIPKNNKVGAISEMLFYSYLIQDVRNKKILLSSADEFMKKVPNTDSICTYLLAPSKHVLLNEEVFKTLNSSLSNIRFNFIEIDNNITFKKYDY